MSKKMIACKTCGQEIAKSAKACPHCGAKNNTMSVFSVILMIFVVFVTVFLVVGILSDEEGPTKIGEVSTSAAGTDVSVQPPAQTRFAVGEKVSLNGVVATLKNVTEDTGTTLWKPTDGYVFLICEFEIENNSSSDIAVSSLLSFEAYVDDFSTNLSLTGMMGVNKPQLDGDIAVGKKMGGIVAYEAPEDWKEIEIKFTPNVWAGKDIAFFATKG